MILVKWILFGLFLIVSMMKFYNNQSLFQQLSKKEWGQYIVGFFSAWVVAAIMIMGGSKLTNTIQVDWINYILLIFIILIGLGTAGFIMNKMVPEKLKKFYR